MVLTPRQQVARNLANELGKMDGAWVTSPLPLDDNAKLRFQLLDLERNHVIQTLKDWGWNPVCLSVLPRVHSTGLIAACLYEIDLPRERQPIPQEGIIPKDEIGKRERSRETELMLEAIYGKRR
jgi:hypothetical protein